jgi:thiamine-monophosphate kinase
LKQHFSGKSLRDWLSRCTLKIPGCIPCYPLLGLLRGSAYDVLALPFSEQTLISRIRTVHAALKARGRKASPKRAHLRVIQGIGDDCAVLGIPPGQDLLVTTDFSLEAVHFRREWHPPESVGHRTLTRGLSDIAAMGGEPRAAFLSLALPPKLQQAWVDRFFRGFLKLAAEFGVTLAGGDISQSHSGILADVVVVGTVPKGGAVQRSGARPGDRIYVSGRLGGSAATLRLLSSKHQSLNPRRSPAHFFPTPRVELGRVLRTKRLASSMIDISDGLSTDLGHICEESGVGAEIWEKRIPRASVGKPPEAVAFKFAIHGGEDYELLFTVRPERHVPQEISGVPLTCIGEITRNRQLSLIRNHRTRSKLEIRGWEHFGSPPA